MVATVILMVISAASAGVRADWVEAGVPLLVVGAAVLPVIVEKWASLRIPASLQLQYAALLIAGPYLGGHVGLYQAWDPWDKFVHLYSGFPIAFGIVFALGITLRRYRLDFPSWLEAVLILSFKAFVALLWEIAEFVYDELFDASAQDHNFDTMTDMILGMVGGVVVAAVLIFHRCRGGFGYLDFLLDVPRGEDSPHSSRGLSEDSS